MMKHNRLRIISIAVAVVCLLAAFAMPVGAWTMPTGATGAGRTPPTSAIEPTASTLSEGNWWIIGIGTAVIVGVLVAVFVIWRKRK